MMPPRQQSPLPDQFVDWSFPLFGINVSTEYELQPQLTCRSALNTQVCEPTTLRMRGGTRPGLTKYVPLSISSTMIQCLDQIVLASATALPYPDQTLAFGSGGGIAYPGPSGGSVGQGQSGGFGPAGGSGFAPVTQALPTAPPPPPGAGNLYSSNIQIGTSGNYTTLIPTVLGPVPVNVLQGSGNLPTSWGELVVSISGKYYMQPTIWYQ